ncbi:MAG: peptidyl-prolyl cis-trans isomerase [Candidatus Omnitrophica bacterium]|nr:peptidyl-prolyl cis-trans isomerase [Candidatus Omnitrophota bacterium]
MANKFLKIFLFLVFITSYELRVTSYEMFAQDKIIAIVNDEVITQKDLDDFLNFTRMQLSAEYNNEKDLEKELESLKTDLLDKLIEDRLILQEAKKNKIIIDHNRIKAKIDEIRSHYGSGQEFQLALREQGLSQADIEARAQDQLLMYSIIDLKVRSKISVYPAEITDFYQNNNEEFITLQQREVESLAVASNSLAKDLSQILRQGGDINDLAKQRSLEVNKMTVYKGGELRRDVEEAIFKLKIGEVSGPIEAGETYYIFRLVKIIPPRKQTLSEVQDRIYQYLFNKKMQEELINWLAELKRQAYIKIIQN